MRSTRKLLASLFATVLMATGALAPAAGAQQEADGLVVVQIDNVLNNNDVNVVVPIQAAVGIAANVCGVVVNAAVLGNIDQGTGAPIRTTCDSASRAFNTGSFSITNN